jgi:hypothetical protein
MFIDDANTPLTPLQAYDGGYWRKRALMTRDKAKAARDDRLQLRLLKVAREYDRLAGYADAIRLAQ